EDRAEALQSQAENPQIATGARCEGRIAQRRIRRPAERGRTLRGEEAGQGDEAAEEVHPEREGVQSRECHIRGTDLQRQDRKSTRLNSSHVSSSYAVFCFKTKNYSS